MLDRMIVSRWIQPCEAEMALLEIVQNGQEPGEQWNICSRQRQLFQNLHVVSQVNEEKAGDNARSKKRQSNFEVIREQVA